MPPSNPHPTDDGQRRGDAAEARLRGELVDARSQGAITRFFRPEWFVESSAHGVYIVEAKGQEMFTAPPFDGHGMPKHQAENYMALYRRTGIPTMLKIYDPAGWIYTGWLHELEAGDPPPFNTRGTIKTPRRIYPLSRFTAKADPRATEAA